MATTIRKMNLTPMMSSIERYTSIGMVPPTTKSLTKTTMAAPTKNLGEIAGKSAAPVLAAVRQKVGDGRRDARYSQLVKLFKMPIYFFRQCKETSDMTTVDMHSQF